MRRRNRLVFVGLPAAVLVVLVIATSVGQIRKSNEGSPSLSTTPSMQRTPIIPSTTISTGDEVVARFRKIFRIRDQAIRTRNPLLLEAIYTVDCPCLKGDRQLIRKLKQQQLLWRGIEISLHVQEVERVNDRLWTASAVVITSSFEIVRESGAVVRRIPGGRELSRFALARPTGKGDWLLGQASLIEERG